MLVVTNKVPGTGRLTKIQELRNQGIEHFGCNFDFGGMEHDKVLKSMELFSKEVMPQFT